MELFFWTGIGVILLFSLVVWSVEKYKFIKKNHELEKELAERRKRVAGRKGTWEDKEHR